MEPRPKVAAPGHKGRAILPPAIGDGRGVCGSDKERGGLGLWESWGEWMWVLGVCGVCRWWATSTLFLTPLTPGPDACVSCAVQVS